ncbi:MsnO8 family LLM class oxidoreductase [Sinorhizobium fredii]|uniref:MsnO8 family LLM class oxidoreductase n=1 Tax=Rhizobium fredii TaxID=380 RepID=UPI003C6F0F70
MASSAAEALVAYLLARTSKIRIGSGGVMLQHYSAYKVAKTFNLLASLAPGRVDLGVGNAPGGFPLAARALQLGVGPARKPDFSDQLSDLNTYPTADSNYDGAQATPFPPTAPERFLLGKSVESTELAAAKGWELVFAGRLNGDPDNLRKTFRYERASGGKRPILALAAFAAESEEHARARVGNLRVSRCSCRTARPSMSAARNRPPNLLARLVSPIIASRKRCRACCTARQSRSARNWTSFTAATASRNFMLDTPALSAARRLASIELLAKERPLSSPDRFQEGLIAWFRKRSRSASCCRAQAAI